MPRPDVAAIRALIRSTTTRFRRILKWDESQHPRVPGGSGEASGQFTSGSGPGPDRLAALGPKSLHVPRNLPNRMAREDQLIKRIAQRNIEADRKARGIEPISPKKQQTHVDVLRARGGPSARQSIAAEVAAIDVQRAKDALAQRQGWIDMSSKAPGMERMSGQADIADLMNAPTGTGFGNKPRLTGDPALVEQMRSRMSTSSTQHTPDPVLVSGSVSATKKKFGGSANAAYLVEMEDGTKAVFKPKSGETFHGSFTNYEISEVITNQDFSLAEREAMASEVSFGLGFGELVPETVLREHLNVDGDVQSDDDDEGGGGYDEDYVRELYDEYKEKAQDRIMEAVGDDMGDLYREAQNEHLGDINNRADEAAEIWNDLVEKEFPDTADVDAQREHPALPMGSQQPFERRAPVVLDPLELLDEAEIDVTATMTEAEEDNLRAVMRKHLQDGASELGDVDEDAAREHLQYDKWIEDHADTEARLYDEKFQSFDSWRHDHGYDSDEGGGSRQAAPSGPGSLQRFVKGESYGDPSHEDRTKMAVLDYVLGSMDRHGGNLLYTENDTPAAIDNGYSMPGPEGAPDDFTFRSGIVRNWITYEGGTPESASRTLSTKVRQPMLDALNTTDWTAMADRHPNMSTEERAAFLGRVDKMKVALTTPGGLWTLWKSRRLMS